MSQVTSQVSQPVDDQESALLIELDQRTNAETVEPKEPDLDAKEDTKDESPRYALAEGPWFVQHEAVVGLAHRAKDLPCQDAARAVNRPRTALVVADGAGSSAVSEIGAQAVVAGTVRLLDTLDKHLAELLDGEQVPDPKAARSMGLLFVKHAMGLLKDLSTLHRREMRDFRCTFLLVVIGKKHLLWVKVGDGSVVIERMGLDNFSNTQKTVWISECTALGEVGKGEFANVTQFLDAVTPQDVQFGIRDATDVCGAVAMSDGASEKLVSHDGRSVAGRVSAMLEKLRTDRLRRTELTKMFYEDGFCAGTTGDDRSIAMSACGYRLPSPSPLDGASIANFGGVLRSADVTTDPGVAINPGSPMRGLTESNQDMTSWPALTDPVTVASNKVGALMRKSIKSMSKKRR